jgi:hypothetical protein
MKFLLSCLAQELKVGPKIRTRRLSGLQTPPVSWLGGLVRAAFPSG